MMMSEVNGQKPVWKENKAPTITSGVIRTLLSEVPWHCLCVLEAFSTGYKESGALHWSSCFIVSIPTN